MPVSTPRRGGHWGIRPHGSRSRRPLPAIVVARLAATATSRGRWQTSSTSEGPTTAADWVTGFTQGLERGDPYRHLCSTPNGTRLFNPTTSGLAHATFRTARQSGRRTGSAGSAKSTASGSSLTRWSSKRAIRQRWGQPVGEELGSVLAGPGSPGTYVGHGEPIP